MLWHLIDWFHEPASSYFALRAALEPLHIQYSPDDHSIWVVNSRYAATPALRARAVVRGALSGRVHCNVSHAVPGLATDSAAQAFTLPEACLGTPSPPSQPAGDSDVLFLRLTLTPAANSSAVVVTDAQPWSINTYTLSDPATAMDQVDWSSCNWFRCANVTFADLTALARLPRVELRVSISPAQTHNSGGNSDGPNATAVATVGNPSRTTVAFLVRLRLVGADGSDVLPVFWAANFFTLMPGEVRPVQVNFFAQRVGEAHAGSPRAVAECFNNDRE